MTGSFDMDIGLQAESEPNVLAKLKLQKPEWVFMDGELRRWDEATVHISTEAVVRGLNVFEGLKGYWQPNGDFGFVHLQRHYERLARSSHLLFIPFPMSYEEFESACFSLTNALRQPGNDLYIRATLLGVEGHYGRETRADLVLTGYQWEQKSPDPIEVGVSTWRRAADVVMPPRIKTGSNYQVARLARIEGQGRGYEDMILLNELGRVAESTGACVLIVRDGRVITPPTWEGALESITLDVIESLAESLEIVFERRPVDRTELYVADEVGLVGTLAELTPVIAVDGRAPFGVSSTLLSLSARYLAAVRGTELHPSVELAMCPRS